MSKIREICGKLFGNDNHEEAVPNIVDGVIINPNDNNDITATEELGKALDETYKILTGSDVTEFKEHLAKANKSERTIRDYVYDIKAFANECSPLLASADDIEKFLQPVGAAAAKRKLAAIRAFARFIMDVFDDGRLFAETYKVNLKK